MKLAFYSKYNVFWAVRILSCFYYDLDQFQVFVQYPDHVAANAAKSVSIHHLYWLISLLTLSLLRRPVPPAGKTPLFSYAALYRPANLQLFTPPLERLFLSYIVLK